MSPIFVRPVREQLEHDRLIRFLQAKYKRKLEVGANLGDEQIAPVKIGQSTFFPDLVLTDGRKLAGLVEVETGESVNNLEALAQWVHFSRARVPFHLYVPVPAYDIARRLCEAHQVKVGEIWAYRPLMDGFDLVRQFHDSSAAAAKRKASSPAKPARRPARKAAPTRRPARKAAPARARAKRVKRPRPAARKARGRGRTIKRAR